MQVQRLFLQASQADLEASKAQTPLHNVSFTRISACRLHTYSGLYPQLAIA